MGMVEGQQGTLLERRLSHLIAPAIHIRKGATAITPENGDPAAGIGSCSKGDLAHGFLPMAVQPSGVSHERGEAAGGEEEVAGFWAMAAAGSDLQTDSGCPLP